MRVLMSIGGPSVFETDAPADEILVGTVNGVAWLRRARGGPWRETVRALEGKHISNLVEDPETGACSPGLTETAFTPATTAVGRGRARI